MAKILRNFQNDAPRSRPSTLLHNPNRTVLIKSGRLRYLYAGGSSGLFYRNHDADSWLPVSFKMDK